MKKKTREIINFEKKCGKYKMKKMREIQNFKNNAENFKKRGKK